MDCTHFHQVYVDGAWMCADCGDLPHGEKRRRPMTEWERVKIGFYRSEKKWIDNIKSRMITKDRNGRQIVMSDQGPVPHAPRFLWPKLKDGERI